jgi:N-acetylglucosaminyldiphosphoundecaprenol N-acetyl-beta-D-mannosaminyltransferase
MCPPEFYVAGVRIHAIRVADVVSTIDAWVGGGRRDYIVLTGAHGVVEMQSDPELRAINNRAGLTTPDGMPLVWIGRRKGFTAIEKVYAPDIMTAVFEHGVSRGYKHYFYGGDEGVADMLSRGLSARFPGIRIVGTFCPPFRPLEAAEVADVSDRINRAGPDIVWVGIGCPKQEKWMHQFRPLLHAAALVGVGAGFDFLSGRKPLAPRVIQRSGFEWLYRMVSEPKRLWPRYSRVVPRFLYLAAADYFASRTERRSAP